MNPEEAAKLYHQFVQKVREDYVTEKVKDGKFQAMMEVALVNDGPVSIPELGHDGEVRLFVLRRCHSVRGGRAISELSHADVYNVLVRLRLSSKPDPRLNRYCAPRWKGSMAYMNKTGMGLTMHLYSVHGM